MAIRTLLRFMSVYLFSTNLANAIPIHLDAADYTTGADVSNVIPRVKLEQYTHIANSSSISFEPSTIDSIGCENPDVVPEPQTCQRNYISSGYDSMRYFEYLEFDQPLSTLGTFSGLSVSSSLPIDYFDMTAFSFSGDNFMIFLFDQHDDYLGLRSFGADMIDPDCFSTNEACWYYGYAEDLSSESVYRIALASWAAVVYTDTLTVDVSEPSTLSLLSITLFGFWLKNRNGIVFDVKLTEESDRPVAVTIKGTVRCDAEPRACVPC